MGGNAQRYFFASLDRLSQSEAVYATGHAVRTKVKGDFQKKPLITIFLSFFLSLCVCVCVCVGGGGVEEEGRSSV